MKTIRYASTALLLQLGAALGCGSAMPSEARAPAAEPAPATATARDDVPASPEAELSEPATLAEAEKLLEQARLDFERLALSAPALPQPVTTSPASVPRAAPGDEAPRADKGASSVSGAGAAPPGSGPNCPTACKAYASLSRASEAVCRLDVDDGKRCERARQIREEALRRVALCSCPE